MGCASRSPTHRDPSRATSRAETAGSMRSTARACNACRARCEGCWRATTTLTDVDCANAGPNILEQLAQRKGWACDHLTWYNANRDVCLEQLMAAGGRNRDFAKKIMTVVIYGGAVATDLPPKIKALSTQLDAMRDLAWQDDAYKRLSEHLLQQAQQADEKNPQDQEPAAAAAAERKKLAAAKRSLLALVIQTEERKVILAKEQTLKENGREMGVLIHDGGLVRKLENEAGFPEELLRICEEGIKAKTGYVMRLTVKPLETHLTVPAEFIDADPTVNDASAARHFARIMGDRLVRDGKQIWVHTANGAWSWDEADLQEAATRHADALRLTSVQSKGKRRILDYGGQVSLTRNLLVKLPDVLPRQDGWWLSKVTSDVFKLLCPNGIYDFKTNTVGPFDPSVVCSASIPWKWPESFNEADMDYLDKVLYQDPFDDLRVGAIERHYHMRGVIGDFRMKKMLVALGPPNSGKGVKVALLQAALGNGLVGTFNGNDLLMRHNVDSDLELSFVGRVANKRIAVSSEIKFDKNAAIDGNKGKSMTGGGDQLETRSNFERSQFVIPKCLFVIVANDLPKIAPADEAVLSRLVVVQPSYSFVANPDPRKSEKQADPLLKDKVNTPEMAIAFLGLMRRTSQEWQAADFAEPELPESMKVAATELCPTNDLFEVLSKEYTLAGNERDAVPVAELIDYLKIQGVQEMSENAMGRELTRLRLGTSKTRIDGKPQWCRTGIRRGTSEMPAAAAPHGGE